MLSDPAALAITPSSPAPPGQTSNLINPESRSWNVGLTVAITLTPALISVVLRFYARLKLVRSVGVDDYICALATIFTIAFNGLVLSVLDYPGGGALGPHIWNVSLLRTVHYQWTSIVESSFLRVSNTLIKVTLLAFYLRIFNPVPRLKIMIWAGIVAVVVFLITFLIAAVVLCHPRPGEQPTIRNLIIPDRCFIELPAYTTAATVFSVVTDFYILLIPIHMLPSLKLSRKRKAAVACVFLIGFFACLAGVSNLVIRFVRYPFNGIDDFTWEVIDIYISKVSETNIGLMCACLPAAFPVLVGPMRRCYGAVRSWFKKPEEVFPGSRGYRDIQDTSQDRAIPRAMLTGLRTMIQNISGSTPQQDMIMTTTKTTATTMTTMTTISVEENGRPRPPSAAIVYGNHLRADREQSSRDSSKMSFV